MVIMQRQRVESSVWMPHDPDHGYVYKFLPGRMARRPAGRGGITLHAPSVRHSRGGYVQSVIRWCAARVSEEAASPIPALAAYEAATLEASDEPADDLTPVLPVLIARTTLTAAPPCSPAPVLAGAAA